MHGVQNPKDGILDPMHGVVRPQIWRSEPQRWRLRPHVWRPEPHAWGLFQQSGHVFAKFCQKKNCALQLDYVLKFVL
jgi:hypothetical protein